MLESVELDLDDDILDEDDESFGEDDESDDEAFAERSRVAFRRGVPRISGSLRATRGVNSATLRTPAGNAQLRLPQSVVSLDVFNRAIASLRASHNKLASEVSANRDAIKRVSIETNAVTAATKKALARHRKAAGQNSMMSMLIALMTQQQISRRIDAIPGAPASSGSDSMMMMLPMMMMGDSGGGGSSGSDGNMMMMMVMMMAMGGN
jgi:hypothetical protein